VLPLSVRDDPPPLPVMLKLPEARHAACGSCEGLTNNPVGAGSALVTWYLPCGRIISPLNRSRYRSRSSRAAATCFVPFGFPDLILCPIRPVPGYIDRPLLS